MRPPLRDPWLDLRLLISALLLASSSLTTAVHAQADPEETLAGERLSRSSWLDWRNYEPAVEFGFGVNNDEARSTFGGWGWNASSQNRPTRFDRTGEKALDGSMIQARLRFTMPEFDIPTAPRLFLMGGFTYMFAGDTAVSKMGPAPDKFYLVQLNPPSGPITEKNFHFRIDQQARTAWRAQAGFGASFLLPIDLYDVRVTTSINYLVSRTEISSRIIWGAPKQGTGPSQIQSDSESQSLTTHEVGPGLGLEADLEQWGPTKLTVFADLVVGFPIASETNASSVDGGFVVSPNSPRNLGHFSFEFERDITYTAAVGVRFTWVGF